MPSYPAKAGIQYPASVMLKLRIRGILDHPLEPVIMGLAEGETRWWMMTSENCDRSMQ